MNCVGQFLYDWQTLISGLLAIGAALIGAGLLRQQIAQSELHEAARLRARLASARAVLPLVLDEIASYATAQIDALNALHQRCATWVAGTPSPTFKKLELPSSVISLIREEIEALDANGKLRALELLSDIVCEIQMLTARLEGVEEQLARSGPSGVPLELEGYIVEAAKLYGLAVGLLPFARREDNDGPLAVDWNSANNRLISSAVQIPGVQRIIDREFKIATTIWVAKGEEA